MNLLSTLDELINVEKYPYLDAAHCASAFGPTIASALAAYCLDDKINMHVSTLLGPQGDGVAAYQPVSQHTVLGFLPGVITKGWPIFTAGTVGAIMVPGQREVFYLRATPALLWKFDSSSISDKCNAVLVPYMHKEVPRIAIVTIKAMAIGDALVVLKKPTQHAHVIAVCPLIGATKQGAKRARETETDTETEAQRPAKRGRPAKAKTEVVPPPQAPIDAAVIETPAQPTPAEHVRAILRFQGLPGHVIETLAEAGLETPALLRFVPRLQAYATLPELHRIAIDSLLSQSQQ